MGARTRKKKVAPDFAAMASLYDTLDREVDEALSRLNEQREMFAKALIEEFGEGVNVLIGGRAYRASDFGGGIDVFSEPAVVHES